MKQHSITKKNRRILEIALSLFILLPNLLALCRATDLQTPGAHITYLIYSFLLFIIPSFWFNSKNFFYFQGINIVLGLIENVHLLINEATTSLLFIHTILLTELREAMELTSTVWPLVLIIVLVVAVYYLIVTLFIDNHSFYPKWLRWTGGIVLPILVGVLFIIGKESEKDPTETDVIHSENNSIYHISTLEQCFPFNIYLNTVQAIKQRNKIANYRKEKEDFSFGIQKDASKKPLTIILVLGETARYGNFGINGYERQTTPHLAQEENIISFDSIYSVANLTVVSIPLILTRATPENSKMLSKEKGIQVAFKEAGFYTSWIANQSFGNPVIMTLSQDCDYIYYIPMDPTNVKNRDENLIPLVLPLVEDDENPLKFITMHTLGCHYKYSCRYPEAFRRYQPELSENFSLKDLILSIRNKPITFNNLKTDSIPLEQDIKTILVNSYDNAICYTDYILFKTISMLEEQNQEAIMLYVGDHGENLLDDSRHMMLHGSYDGSHYEYHVPLIIWYSDEYKKNHSELIETLIANKKNKTTTMSVFHTLIELGGINYQNFDSTLSLGNSGLIHVDTIVGVDANLNLKPIYTETNDITER